MKIKMLRGWRWIFVVSSTVALLGCLDQTSGTGAQTILEPSAAAAVAAPANDSQIDAKPEHAIIPPANLSPGLSEVVKLAQSGVSEEVLLAYVQNSSHTFNPSVDEIVYLKDIGISDAVVTAMVRHENTSNEAAQISSNQELAENKTALDQSPTNSTGPSLIDPNAPSYSVNAEPSYNDAASVAQPEQVNINYFESTLSPYGNWVDVPEYGRCWQPTVVVINRSWRPYADRGRWVYTSSGWYWQSDYSWGWAPFHYGRWYCDNRVGWVWVPGSTWGPAWVSWRYTDQYCGWAPLPPSARYYGSGFYYGSYRVGISFDFGLRDDFYTFIPTSRFCERTPSHFYVPRSHSKTIYKNSVVINNYFRGSNNTVINEGVGRERITRATHTPIRTVALHELPTSSNPVGRAERLEGNSLTVFRPNVSASGISRSNPQRSITTAAPAQHHSPESTRSIRSIPKTETATSALQVQSPTVSVSPIEQKPTTITRSVSPSVVERHSSRPTTTSKGTTTAENPSHRSIVTTRPGPSESRNFSGQSSPQQINRSIGRRESIVVPGETPRVMERNIAPSITQTPTLREAPLTRTGPSAPQIQRAEPTVREIRRQEIPEINRGNAQNSFRSIAPRPTPSAPAPVQNFTPPREINRGFSRVERSAPPAAQPSFSAPAPSLRQSAPRQETPAPRERIERSVERSVRSGRDRS